MAKHTEKLEFGPWNPGLSSTIPRKFLSLSTMHRPENVSTSLAEAEDLADFTGLPAKDLVRFRPERMLQHEVLIRVMANISVPDGSHYGDLGINFRQYCNAILDRYLTPKLDEISKALEMQIEHARVLIDNELTRTIFASVERTVPIPAKPTFWQRLGFGRKPDPAPSSQPAKPDLAEIQAAWRPAQNSAVDPTEIAAFAALIKATSAIAAKHGKLIGDKTIITQIALTFVSNSFGSEEIGRLIEEDVHTAAEAEGLRHLPVQAKPIIMNVKGASAAGKSTLRPLQQKLAERIGVNWQDFALISPDIFRKFLLDYDSLGEAEKYAGMLTGHEVEIIDQKLDRYMAEKSEKGPISHLLIDRFRFDSFAVQPGEADGGRLLTRFGDLVYMFFVITPPEATVERAWGRGLEYGRYKAIDDLLDHNVEAFTGMPRLFFTWALNTSKRVHYEFLDNSVPKGERPKTIAFGWNGEMTILDLKSMINVDRFRKINVDADTAKQIYDVSDSLEAEDNTDFLKQCGQTLPVLNFANQETGMVYAQVRHGTPAWADMASMAKVAREPDHKAGLEALFGDLEELDLAAKPSPNILIPSASSTLGQWGPATR